MSQVPVAVGLFLCEQAIIEEQTHNITLVNTFTRRVVDEIPWAPTNFVLFAVLTDGLGDVPLNLLIYRLHDMEEVFASSGKMRFTNPLNELRCLLRVRNCLFTEEGFYQVTLLAAGEQVAQRRFVIQVRGSHP